MIFKILYLLIFLFILNTFYEIKNAIKEQTRMFDTWFIRCFNNRNWKFNVNINTDYKNVDIPHKCKEHLVFDHTIDTVLPFGNIDSSAVFKCEICGKEFREEEFDNE